MLCGYVKRILTRPRVSSPASQFTSYTSAIVFRGRGERRSPSRKLHIIQDAFLRLISLPITPAHRALLLRLQLTNIHATISPTRVPTVPIALHLLPDTQSPSLHLTSDILNNRTLPSPRHPPHPLPTHPPLHPHPRHLPTLPSRHSDPIPREHDPG